MTSLHKILHARILASGPISVAEYMEMCLGHETHGYYVTRDPLGMEGDFTTAPEISQMFGEMIGAWLAQVWLDQGAPRPFVLAELGPGRGTLMRDMLRVLDRVPGCVDAAQVCCVEMSPVLRRLQQETLRGVDATWLNRVTDLPEGPLFVVANEFFDALPVQQFQRVDAFWRERLVGVSGDRLGFVWGAPVRHPELERRFGNVSDGTVVETCPAAATVAGRIGASISSWGGGALIVDYGAWEGTGDTVQALREHSPVHPLTAPGDVDLTAHVRFSDVARAAGPGIRHQSGPQGAFLEHLGMGHRAAVLTEGKDSLVVEQVTSAHRRLTHPDEMGQLYQVMALSPETAPAPPGFV